MKRAGVLSQHLTASPTEGGKPKVMYFPFGGRGELSRLIAAAGGLEIDDGPLPKDWKEVSLGMNFYGSIPLLQHGNFNLCQSVAIEGYLASIAPKFAGLTPQQRAVDAMFCATKEDVLSGCTRVLFQDRKNAEKAIPEHLDKFLPQLEKQVPADGFVHGLGFPTAADMAVLNMVKVRFPFTFSYQEAKYDCAAKHPKLAALAERTAKAPGVAEYLAQTKSVEMSPLK